MRLAVFGLGYVGMATAIGMAKIGHDIIGVDIKPFKVELINSQRSTINEPGVAEAMATPDIARRIRATLDAEEAVLASDVSLICVGTPPQGDGDIDLRFVRRTATSIGVALRQSEGYHVIAIRSTVFPGTARGMLLPVLARESGKRAGVDFGVCVNPEFLREASLMKDFQNPEVILIGSSDERATRTLIDMYRDLPGQVVCVDLETAEVVKYANNAFHAVKISFANEIGNICERLGIDGRRVMKILCMDSRLNISPAYLRPGFAFGGSCLTKDLKTMIVRSHQAGYTPQLLESTLHVNAGQIEKAYRLAGEMLDGDVQGKRVAMLGVTFKEGTDDIRESPVFYLAQRLAEAGAQVVVHDDAAAESLRAAQTDHLEHALSLIECVREAELCIVGLGKHSVETIGPVLAHMQTPRVLNLRNEAIYDGMRAQSQGDFEYRDIISSDRRSPDPVGGNIE